MKKGSINREPLYKLLYWILFAGIIALTAWNTFGVIGETTIFDWDEARHGVSAYEMLESGDYLTQTYLGEIDYWNLKPPLSFWSIAAAYKLFGLGQFSLRFFSALALNVVVVVSMLFFRKHYHAYISLATGLLFSLIGVQMNHLFLHGDPDGLFYLFFFLAILFFCKAYLGSDRYLIVSGLSVALAFLAKASHVAVLGMILVISAILLRKVKRIPLSHWLIYWILPMAAPVLIWAIARYNRDGFDFLSRMFFVDIVDRASTGLEGNGREDVFYFKVLPYIYGPLFCNLLLVLILTCILLLILRRHKLDATDKVFSCVGLLTTLFPLFFYSFMATKLAWYIWPTTIGMVLLITWLLRCFYEMHQAEKRKDAGTVTWPTISAIIGCALAVALASMPNQRQMQYISDSSTVYPEQSVFYQLPQGNRSTYSVVDEAGEQLEFSQSWILHGIYTGYDYRPGGLEAFAAGEDIAYLIVRDGGAAFEAEHPALQKIYELDGFTVYAKA